MELGIDILAMLFAAAFIAAFIDAIAGGGGLITIPALLMTGMPPAMALGTNKLQAFGGALSASIYFLRKRAVNLSEFSFILLVVFISSGRRAMVISLDDFYLDTDKTPLNRKGKPDFETIYSLDIERINLCIDELVNKGKTLMPIFDFHTRKRVEGQEKEIAISGDDVVIIEGLHGLNPLLTQRVGEDKVTRIFASVRSRFTDHDRVLLTPQDVRLMRRMVRDRSTRNTTPEQTMAMWDEVCEGESEYINPYRDSADFKLDTTLDYEPNIFHSYLLPFLENRSGIAPEHYRKLDELYQRLDEFFDINNTQAIPADSVVREFIGPRRESEQTE